MTNEEVERLAYELNASLWSASAGVPGAVDFQWPQERFLEILASYTHDVASQAYDKAAWVVCRYCLREYDLHQYSGGGWYHTDTEGNDWPCAGSNVRALKDSLVPETVSS